MGQAQKKFFETEIARQEREIASMERKAARGEGDYRQLIALNRSNIAGYRAELAAEAM